MVKLKKIVKDSRKSDLQIIKKSIHKIKAILNLSKFTLVPIFLLSFHIIMELKNSINTELL